MTGPVMVLAEFGAVTVLAAGAINDAGRAAVIGLAGVATIAVGKWVWGAIVRALKAAVVEASGEKLDEVKGSIDALAARNDLQHAENGLRLNGIEQRQAVVEAGMAVQANQIAKAADRTIEIIASLADLSAHVADLRDAEYPRAIPPKEH